MIEEKNENNVELKFRPVFDINKKILYQELRLPKSENTYMKLLDIFFRPREMFGDEQFFKIFPKMPDYLKKHKSIPSTNGFLPWNGWLFRGMSKSSYRLRTSFERLCYNDLFDKETRITKEMGLLRDFMRKIRNYMPEFAHTDLNDYYEYMALFQHMGGATRFLDVSYSFFVALFFSIWHIPFSSQDIILPELIEKEQKYNPVDKNECAIWCFNRMWIENTYKKLRPGCIKRLYKKYDEFGKDTRIQKAVLDYVPRQKRKGRSYEEKFLSVINMTPYFMNDRMIKQRGMFLMPTNPYRTFEENLFGMVSSESDSWRILKIVIPYDNRTLLFLRKCLDEMNINNAVLFNGVDNLCADINQKLSIPSDALIVSPNAGIGHK